MRSKYNFVALLLLYCCSNSIKQVKDKSDAVLENIIISMNGRIENRNINGKEFFIERYEFEVQNTNKRDTFFFDCFRDSFLSNIGKERKLKKGKNIFWVTVNDGYNNILYNAHEDSISEVAVYPRTSKKVYFETFNDSINYINTDSLKVIFDGKIRGKRFYKYNLIKYGKKIPEIELRKYILY